MKPQLIAILSSLLLLPSTALLSLPVTDNIPQIAQLSPESLQQTAKAITVRVLVKDTQGSGFITAKQGNTYTVVTNAHVVEDFNQHKIITPDGQTYPLSPQQITILNKDIDIALVTFESDKTYQVAELGNYSLKDAQWVFVSGFPAKNRSKQRRLTAGIVRDKEQASFATKDEFSLSNGQELLYTSLSLPGMSGGAILDIQGRGGLLASIQGQRMNT